MMSATKEKEILLTTLLNQLRPEYHWDEMNGTREFEEKLPTLKRILTYAKTSHLSSSLQTRLATLNFQLGTYYLHYKHDLSNATQHFQAALPCLEGLAHDWVTNQLGWCQYLIAIEKQGVFSEDLQRDLLAIQDNLIEKYQYHPTPERLKLISAAFLVTGLIQQSCGRYQSAYADFNCAQAAHLQSEQPLSLLYAKISHGYFSALAKLGHLSRALQGFRALAEFWKPFKSSGHPSYATLCISYAELIPSNADKLIYYTQGYQALRQALGEKNPLTEFVQQRINHIKHYSRGFLGQIFMNQQPPTPCKQAQPDAFHLKRAVSG